MGAVLGPRQLLQRDRRAGCSLLNRNWLSSVSGGAAVLKHGHKWRDSSLQRADPNSLPLKYEAEFLNSFTTSNGLRPNKDNVARVPVRDA